MYTNWSDRILEFFERIRVRGANPRLRHLVYIVGVMLRVKRGYGSDSSLDFERVIEWYEVSESVATRTFDKTAARILQYQESMLYAKVCVAVRL